MGRVNCVVSMRAAMELLGNPVAVLNSIEMLLVTPESITLLVPMIKRRGPWFAVLPGAATNLNQIVAVKLLMVPRLPIFASLFTNAIVPATLPRVLLVD